MPNKRKHIPEVVIPSKPKNGYFYHGMVENLIARYQLTGCTDVVLRDEIMIHAPRLIDGIIKRYRMQLVARETVQELQSVGWVQIEKTLYKPEIHTICRTCRTVLAQQPLEPEKAGKCECKCGHPPRIYYRGKSKVYSMWTQVVRTVVLAHTKKNQRDDVYCEKAGVRWLRPREQEQADPRIHDLSDFYRDARACFKYDELVLQVLDAIEYIQQHDPEPSWGIGKKVSQHLNLPAHQVHDALRRIRMRQGEIEGSGV